MIEDLPSNALEQLTQLPPMEQQEEILRCLYCSLDVLLTGNSIVIDRERTSYRVKTQERIDAKLKRRGTGKLILDIYGIQLILPND